MSGQMPTTDCEAVAVRNVHRLGRNLVHAISVCFKNGSLYDSANVIVQGSAQDLIQTVRTINGMEGRVTLDIVLDFVALNEVHIRPPMEGHHLFNSLIDQLSSKDIGALSFAEDLTLKEVTDFSQLINSVPADADDPFGQIMEGMQSYAIRTIEAIPTRQINRDDTEADMERNLKEKSVKHFFQAIRSSRRVLEGGSSKKVDFRRARRVVRTSWTPSPKTTSSCSP